MESKTLAEILIDHDDMFDHVMKDGKLREFINIGQARAYRGAMVTNSLRLLGIDVPSVLDLSLDGEAASKRFDELMVKNQVVIENRKEIEGRPAWERGIYIYKAGELVYFISIIFPRDDHFTVRSNVPEMFV